MTQWLDEIVAANTAFQERVQPEKLPTERVPGQAIITCMDPRINLEAVGILSFSANGAGSSNVRIIRTLGGRAEYRSLIVGVYLAGFREIVLLMHTDCGCSLAYHRVDTIAERMQQRLPEANFQRFQSQIGTSFEQKLRTYLQAFQDPYEAVRQEIETIRQLPFVPGDLILHGLVYNLETGAVDVVINGYSSE